MSLDAKLSQQLLEIFKTELEEKSQVITDGLLALEKTNLNDEETEATIVAIFRAAHNIKGSARSLNIDDIAQISHSIETLFSAIQKKTVTISASMISLCLEAVDGMRAAMQAFIDKQPLPFDLAQLLLHLQTGEKKDISPKVVAIPERRQTPRVEEVSKEYETIRVAISNLDCVSAMMEELQTHKIAIDDHYAELAKLNKKITQFSRIWQKTFSSLKYNNAIPENLQKSCHTCSDYLTEISDTLSQLYKNMHARMNGLTVLCDSMQEEVRMLRLIPAATLLRGFPRTARDLAKDLHKTIDLRIKDEGVKIDKMVLEALKDPLTHLLRNAIDHGIESADIRKEQGKPETGHVVIEVTEEGNQVFFNITDDGSGIDVKKIAKIALAKNLLTQSDLENMTDNELLELLFKPGFSTKEMITDISGRGVGLDVVKVNVTNLKGDVSIITDPGKGTTFQVRVPLTLATDRGLMVKSGGQLFMLPTNSINRILQLNADEIIEVEASQAILLEGHAVPLRVLSNILNVEKKEVAVQGQLSLVVMHKNRQKVALLVEDIVGEREMVIKPLQAPLTNIPAVSGGTLDGNGQVIMVLNPNHLMTIALPNQSVRINKKESAAKITALTHILVADDSITTRTLEKNVLETNGYKVTVAVNGKEAWDLLQKQKFSLLITDVDMPIMDGFSLTERVKKSDAFKQLPVIIVTSLDSEAEKKRGIDVGADAYIVKNEFESSGLLEVVAQLV